MARAARVVFFIIAGAAPLFGPDQITIVYPEDGSVFPPELTPPAFLWRDSERTASAWTISIEFRDGSSAIVVNTSGECPRVGDIDPRAVAETNRPPVLTPELAAARVWTPALEIWEQIKRHSVSAPAIVTIARPGAVALVTIQTSKDPVGAPIFYRDVPLMPSEVEKGVIKPLAPVGIPLIAWRLRYLAEPRSRVVLEGLHSCTNCHSFSRDGKFLGMDVDGPENDKGTYAIAPVSPRMTIRNHDVITWSSFPSRTQGRRTIGFLSQISPDAQYAVSTVDEEVYVANFKDYRFLQVFYPTRGILAFYNRASREIKPLRGADDPRFVHTDAVWSPDGEYLVFARAEAKDAYPRGRKLAEFPNDPNEVPVQYDLYRIPFNGGRGGKPEPIAGASANGMSNTFPKISPDGRWIVFVQCRNGQLLRPDSQLYIVPAEGGRAWRMRANTPLMNSWHSFSPNSRWLVFSSKGRSPYTQMFLTHLDDSGNDSPAILIEDSTAANRAVNLPEFVNIPLGGLLKIDVPAAEFYRLFDSALALGQKGMVGAAVAEWEKALALDPDSAKARTNYGIALRRNGALADAVAQFREAVQLKPDYTEARNNLGVALVETGRSAEAILHFRVVLGLNPGSAEARNNLAVALLQAGRYGEALSHFRVVLLTNPNHVPVLNQAAWLLATCPHAQVRDGAEALRLAGRAVRLSSGRDPAVLDTLAAAYAELGRFPEALEAARQAASLAAQQRNQAVADAVRDRIVLYERQIPFRETPVQLP
jgi:tetratricopeptide (TPR) repeat protein